MGKPRQSRGKRRGRASQPLEAVDARGAQVQRNSDPLLLGTAGGPEALRPARRGLPRLCEVFRALRLQNEAQQAAVAQATDTTANGRIPGAIS